jgi:predicted DNA-binding antitoxin AbrB/MazE fold protein
VKLSHDIVDEDNTEYNSDHYFMNDPTPRLGAPSNTVIRAIRGVLKPLVRFMLAQGLTYTILIDLLKSIYVEVALSEFKLEKKRQTDSRISLLTGVHRKDVKRLSEMIEADAPPPENVTLGAQLVAKWIGQAPFVDKSGHPIPLARGKKEGGEKSFEALVSSVSKDIRSRAVLDEWLRLGIVHIDSNDCVCLDTEAFIPKQGFEEKAYYFQHNLHDHIAASVNNMLDLGPPFVERSVHYDTLTKSSAAELVSLGEALGMQALQTVNRRALILEKKDANHPDANQRINFGIYFYYDKQENANPGQSDSDEKSLSK